MDPNIQQTLDCYKPGNAWPDIGSPGLPNICQGVVAATNAGVEFVTPFLPPNPLLPCPPAPLGLFQSAFMGGANLSGPSGVSFGNAAVMMIFEVFSMFIITVNALSPVIPDEGTATGLFSSALSSSGLTSSGPLNCIPKTVLAIMKTKLPV